MSVEDDIKNAVQSKKPYDADFMDLRAKVRGTLINAHRTLGPKDWNANDDRILDIVAQWLENCRERRST